MLLTIQKLASDEAISEIDSPSLGDIERVVNETTWDDITYAILSQDPHNFIECSGSRKPEDGWSCRVVQDDKEFFCARVPESVTDIVWLLSSYCRNDDEWREWINWAGSTAGHVIGLPEAMRWPADADLEQRFSYPTNQDVLRSLTSGTSLAHAHGDITEELLQAAKSLPSGWDSYSPSRRDFAYEFLYSKKGEIFAVALSMQIALRLPDDGESNMPKSIRPAEGLGRDWYWITLSAQDPPLTFWIQKAFQAST